ncbi:hypothetical protein VSR82_23265 [Burkholderia sp. JPY481]|uniref:hypothetical protein n=1 Tax=unclassified Paraburkholderia TaxID=2615204 RepID=UPI003173C044
MPTRTITKGNHTYRIVTIGVAEGGYTFEIIHIDRSRNVIKEVRHQPGIAYALEETALDNGIQVATEMAGQQKD